MNDPLALFPTWTTSGWWLPGVERGWVEKPGRFREPDEFRREATVLRWCCGPDMMKMLSKTVRIRLLNVTMGNEFMLKSVEGVYRDGKIELLEPAPDDATGRVIVTFLSTARVALEERGIDVQQAAELRHRLAAFADDWDRPEMDVYDAL